MRLGVGCIRGSGRASARVKARVMARATATARVDARPSARVKARLGTGLRHRVKTVMVSQRGGPALALPSDRVGVTVAGLGCSCRVGVRDGVWAVRA